METSHYDKNENNRKIQYGGEIDFAALFFVDLETDFPHGAALYNSRWVSRWSSDVCSYMICLWKTLALDLDSINRVWYQKS